MWRGVGGGFNFFLRITILFYNFNDENIYQQFYYCLRYIFYTLCIMLCFDLVFPSPFWNLSSRNRVTLVSIPVGVQHGITFAAIATIPAALLPILAALLRSVRRPAVPDVAIPIVMLLTDSVKHSKTS